MTRVVVVGGGLAGIAAALRLADTGCAVTLLEGRPRLGGLTHSFRRDGTGGAVTVDNGQHVFLRCCTQYLDLLDRLGVRDKVHLQPRLRIPVHSPRGAWLLRRSGLPAPLHRAGSLLRYGAMSWTDRVLLGPAMLAMRRLDRASAWADEQNFGRWLARHHQSARAVEVLWNLITVPTLNAPAAESSLALAATVFQLGLLTDPAAADIGWSAVPLQELHGDAAVRALAEVGADVRPGRRVTQVDAGGATVQVHCRDGEIVEADAVVLATPPEVTARLVDASTLGLPADWADRLGTAPIVDVHLVLDRPVLDEPFIAAVDSPVQWVFDRTDTAGLRSGQYLAVSLSAADAWIDEPAARVVDTVTQALCKLLPGLSAARVLDSFVTRERHATFRPAPGVSHWRPTPGPVRTGSRLAVAGAWTSTGWPATMEGAVRSGNAAADALLASLLPRSSKEATAA